MGSASGTLDGESTLTPAPTSSVVFEGERQARLSVSSADVRFMAGHSS